MNVQIRIRTDAKFDDILSIADWLIAAEKGFAFRHNKPGNIHYHIYLFNIERNPDAMRRHLFKYHDKQDYMVGTTAGKKKEKISPMIAYQYAMNPKSNPERVWVKGFEDDEINTMETEAKAYYTPIQAVQVIREDHYIVRPDRVWERLYANLEKYKGKSINQIKSSIATEWLNNGKAIPRNADLHRYAVSLFTINKYDAKDWPEIPDWALTDML